MKIDFIISSIRGGGAERVLSLMTNSLVKTKKYDISVITLYKGSEAYSIHSAINRIQLKKNNILPTLTLKSFYNLIRHYKKKENRPDVIVSFSTSTNFITIIVAKIFSIRIIAQEHISHLSSEIERDFKVNFTRKHLYKKADILTVLTSFDIEYYKNYGAEVVVMPNPCTFKSITTNTHLREKTILAIGSLNRHHHKGFDNLIKLVVPILKKHPDWRLKIAGSGDKGHEYLLDLAKRHKVVDKIIFLGFVDDISELMNQSSIFVLSSRFEGLPMVLLEAMSQGMACIAFDCITGPSDIITNKKNGLLIENQNLIEMQRGLFKLIENQELRQHLSNQAIQSLDKFDISEITRRYELLFHKLTIRS